MYEFFLSYLLLNKFWATQQRKSIFIQQGEVLSDKGKLRGGNSEGNIAYTLSKFQSKINNILKTILASWYRQ